MPWGIESGQVSGGDVNLFRYAGNNSVNRNDPSGQDMINDLTLPAVPLTPPLRKTASKPVPPPMLSHPLLHPALAGIKHQLADPSITPLPQSLSHSLLYKPSLPALPSNALARKIYAAELAHQQSHTAAPEQMITLGATPHAIGAPGFWTSLIPIYGSGRAAINDYQTGHWGWGLFNTALAASDVLLVGDLYKIGAKLVVKGGAEILEKEGGQEVLAHLTSREAELAIRRSGVIYGKYGIFALRSDRVPESIFLRHAWTWVPNNLRGSVEVTSDLSRYFHPPPIRGPVSLFRRFIAGVRETDLGTVVLSPKPEFRAFEIWDKAAGTLRRATPREMLRWAGHTFVLNNVDVPPFNAVGHLRLASVGHFHWAGQSPGQAR